ncbi:AraC family transcriptional regulator [Natranaerovirga hydrolytica]|uniref:AraC family transcriptional regulator n=1 Tax=Natranaerovirga hydrolytica TaxID=680378 RepID=A0A4R1MYU6_9FIRM|nr:AraC family transcriptional regulator [Natranaerovirga hydrolytica]TCK98488.1 AraC family transcriptional regulator [Natranaerovirga hydrolytica]
MNGSLISKKIYSLDDSLTDIVNEFRSLYMKTIPLKENTIYIPPHLAKGYYKRVVLDSEIEITNGNMLFHKEVSMSDETKGDAYGLYFALGNEMYWTEKNTKTDWCINEKQGIVTKINDLNESCVYEKNKQYDGFNIIISKNKLIKYIAIDDLLSVDNEKKYGQYITVTQSIKRILLEIENNPYENEIKYIYLESKILELFSEVFNQLLERRSSIQKCLLSKSDLNNIYTAKEIIDSDISRAFTIKDLAKCVGINEGKLKEGFKMVEGKPVHTYIIDQRLEKALIYLENGYLVHQVAFMVGYQDPSSFSRAFKKKYGLSPIKIRS